MLYVQDLFTHVFIELQAVLIVENGLKRIKSRV